MAKNSKRQVLFNKFLNLLDEIAYYGDQENFEMYYALCASLEALEKVVKAEFGTVSVEKIFYTLQNEEN